MYQDGTGGIMKTPEIYKEVDIRKCSLTDGDVLCEHLLVLACPRRFPVRGALFVRGAVGLFL